MTTNELFKTHFKFKTWGEAIAEFRNKVEQERPRGRGYWEFVTTGLLGMEDGEREKVQRGEPWFTSRPTKKDVLDFIESCPNVDEIVIDGCFYYYESKYYRLREQESGEPSDNVELVVWKKEKGV